MPRKKKEKKQESVGDAISNAADVVFAVNQLADALKALEARLVALEARLVALEGKGEPQKVEEIKLEVKPEVTVSDPVPLEWRQVVSDVLNDKFGVAVKYRGDAQFELTIDVPQEYSNASKGTWDTIHRDHRIMVMGNHMGVQGVRLYTEKVAKNLGPDLMKKVHEDKLQHAQPA